VGLRTLPVLLPCGALSLLWDAPHYVKRVQQPDIRCSKEVAYPLVALSEALLAIGEGRGGYGVLLLVFQPELSPGCNG
jgi:hypothetical protein